MNGIVDWLPYVDSPVGDSRLQVENLVERELLNVDMKVLHPGVESLLGSETTSRFAQQSSPNESKRDSETNDQTPVKKPCLGVDKSRYVVERCTTRDQQATLESYLGHHESVLSQLMGRTLARQWVTNNEYMNGVCDALREISDSQERNIQDLEKHRELIQSEAQRDLAYMEDRWKETLLRNVERALDSAGGGI
ncbi:LAME_0E05798g1_1 [Lachancea meyersii CBS 8951]|uniref:LAME_0E05798g1_1 n=1 Tax=Lachancea meyersii CBS 8951 TaxID=1266667 RepID=A0A1G4JHT5_9SACH|nr:LAME_0E05798g1_1 [Lachancea meyersii CBS 8951]